MKSYFKFLSRNAAYTIINVLGLSLGLMFAIIIGAYVWQETTLDKQQTKADRIYLLGDKSYGGFSSGSHWRAGWHLVDQFPEIESSCAISFATDDMHPEGGELNHPNFLLVDSTFFKFFDFKLLQGDRRTALNEVNSVVITPQYAKECFGDADPIGKAIVWNHQDVQTSNLIVTGIFEPLEHTLFETDKIIDMIMRFENNVYVSD
ncbi:MAG: ABC transporter permease, partial [Muribaculaceae bacterium]|nr:ABC transporter permease [Muribaculaceae bacterium]